MSHSALGKWNLYDNRIFDLTHSHSDQQGDIHLGRLHFGGGEGESNFNEIYWKTVLKYCWKRWGSGQKSRKICWRNMWMVPKTYRTLGISLVKEHNPASSAYVLILHCLTQLSEIIFEAAFLFLQATSESCLADWIFEGIKMYWNGQKQIKFKINFLMDFDKTCFTQAPNCPIQIYLKEIRVPAIFTGCFINFPIIGSFKLCKPRVHIVQVL